MKHLVRFSRSSLTNPVCDALPRFCLAGLFSCSGRACSTLLDQLRPNLTRFALCSLDLPCDVPLRFAREITFWIRYIRFT